MIVIKLIIVPVFLLFNKIVTITKVLFDVTKLRLLTKWCVVLFHTLLLTVALHAVMMMENEYSLAVGRTSYGQDVDLHLTIITRAAACPMSSHLCLCVDRYSER